MPYSTVVSNQCTCIYCDKCEMASSYEDECPECQGEGRPIDCYGDCYTDAVESAEAFIAEWVGDHNADWFVETHTCQPGRISAGLISSASVHFSGL